MIKSHEKVCKNKNILEIVFPSSKNNILEFNQYKKLDKMLYIIYTNIESLIKKIERSANNLEKTSTTKVGKHIPGGYSMPTIWALDHIENTHSLYCREDGMKKFCRSLREHASSALDFKKKKNCRHLQKNS